MNMHEVRGEEGGWAVLSLSLSLSHTHTLTDTHLGVLQLIVQSADPLLSWSMSNSTHTFPNKGEKLAVLSESSQPLLHSNVARSGEMSPVC